MNQSQVSAGSNHIMSSPHQTVICTRAGTQLTCLWLDPQLPEHSLHMVGAQHMLPEWVPLSMPVWACVSQGCGSQYGTTMCMCGAVCGPSGANIRSRVHGSASYLIHCLRTGEAGAPCMFTYCNWY